MPDIKDLPAGVIELAVMLSILIALASPVLVLFVFVAYHILTAPRIGQVGIRFLLVLTTAEAIALAICSSVISLFQHP